MRRASRACLLTLVLSALPLHGAQYAGSVRAADQFVPGATVIAQQGTNKITAFTDENGRYTMDLAPGVWDIRIEMFEFTSAAGQIVIGADSPVQKDWTLEMPRLGQPAGTVGPQTQQPGAGRQRFRNGGVRGGGAGRAGGFGPAAADHRSRLRLSPVRTSLDSRAPQSGPRRKARLHRRLRNLPISRPHPLKPSNRTRHFL